jgi:hypothetical protein
MPPFDFCRIMLLLSYLDNPYYTMAKVQARLTYEQLDSPLATEIIKPSQRFPSATIFHNDEAKYWYESKDEEKVPEGKETYAEKRRRKREERAAAARQREEERRAQRDARAARAAVPVAVAAAHAPVHVPPPVHAHVAAAAPAPIHAPMHPWPLSEAAREDTFWRIIADFKWHNRGEGPNPTKRVRDIVASWPADYRATFTGLYRAHVDTMLQSMRADLAAGVDMFQRNDIFTNEAGIASHFVALGRDAYTNLLMDHETIQILIMAGMEEWEDFNALMPADVKL